MPKPVTSLRRLVREGLINGLRGAGYRAELSPHELSKQLRWGSRSTWVGRNGMISCHPPKRPRGRKICARHGPPAKQNLLSPADKPSCLRAAAVLLTMIQPLENTSGSFKRSHLGTPPEEAVLALWNTTLSRNRAEATKNNTQASRPVMVKGWDSLRIMKPMPSTHRNLDQGSHFPCDQKPTACGEDRGGQKRKEDVPVWRDDPPRRRGPCQTGPGAGPSLPLPGSRR